MPSFKKQRKRLEAFSLLGELNIRSAAENKHMLGPSPLFDFVGGKSKPGPLLNMHGCTCFEKRNAGSTDVYIMAA